MFCFAPRPCRTRPTRRERSVCSRGLPALAAEVVARPKRLKLPCTWHLRASRLQMCKVAPSVAQAPQSVQDLQQNHVDSSAANSIHGSQARPGGCGQYIAMYVLPSQYLSYCMIQPHKFGKESQIIISSNLTQKCCFQLMADASDINACASLLSDTWVLLRARPHA
jgi:hypothetical protein